mmetsp:Transcript_40313/g.90673  ORF Transcript_40313/g.90673 Transcript_40313/m.90673 type:complete len:84 (+) Transcript_40313:437-688(+)
MTSRAKYAVESIVSTATWATRRTAEYHRFPGAQQHLHTEGRQQGCKQTTGATGDMAPAAGAQLSAAPPRGAVATTRPSPTAKC